MASRRLEFKLWGWQKLGGDIVWRGAYVLAHELCRQSERLRGVEALELGAGSGLAGAVAAHLGARVVVSDGDPAEVPQLEANAALLTEACPGAVFAAVVEWGAAAAVDAARTSTRLRERGFDLILGSDVVYMPQHIPSLAESIAYFLADSGRALIANTAVATSTTHPAARALFLDALQAAGLDVEVQSLDGVALRNAAGLGISCAPTDYFLTITRRGSGL